MRKGSNVELRLVYKRNRLGSAWYARVFELQEFFKHPKEKML